MHLFCTLILLFYFRYYCGVYLDEMEYAKTGAKLKSDMCFWGESFDFENISSNISSINVHLYREGKNRRRNDKNILIGKCKDKY